MMMRVKLHEENGLQTLTIPLELTIPASEVFVTKEGEKLTIEPVMVKDKSSFFEWLRTVEPWNGPPPDIEDPLPEDIKS